MFKTTMIHVVVYSIIIASCLATLTQEADFQSNVSNHSFDTTISSLISHQDNSSEWKITISSLDTTSYPYQGDHLDGKESTVTEYSSLIINKTAINRDIDDSAALITKFLNDTDGYNQMGCSDLQVKLSSSINKLVRLIVTQFIVREKNDLSIIRTSKFPNIKGEFSNRTAITGFKLNNITLKGLDTLLINKLEYNVCKLSTDIDLDLPKLELTATYTLNGSIDNTPLFGDGNLTLNAYWVYFAEQSLMMRGTKYYSRKTCHLVNHNETIDIGAEEVKIHLTGIKYGNLTESEFNGALNNYVRHYLKSDKTQLKQIVSNIFTEYKKKHLMNIHPLELLTMVKKYLKIAQTLMNRRSFFSFINPLITFDFFRGSPISLITINVHK